MTRAYTLIVTVIFGLAVGACSDDRSIDEKLQERFATYDDITNQIASEVYEDNSEMSRFGLKWRLGDVLSEPFSEDDLSMIRERHSAVIAESALAAKEKSIIDLNAIRQNRQALQGFCQAIPKGGMLHVHPWGLFTRDVVRDILEQYDPIIQPGVLKDYIENKEPKQYLYDTEVEALLSLPEDTRYSDYTEEQKNRFLELFILPAEPAFHEFERFDSIFTFVDHLLDGPGRDDKLKRVYIAFLKQASEMGVSYVEFTEYFYPDVANIRKLEMWADEFYAQTGIIVRWNISFLRFEPAEENADMLWEWNALLKDNPTEVITGIDLLSIEKGYPAFEAGQKIYGYQAGYNRANPELALKTTMHAGEMGDIRNVRDALLLGADRIGHGVLLKEDPVTLEYARRKNLPIEVNMISNHKLGAHDIYEAPHPFLDYLRLGLRVSLSTDNDAIFETDIAQECVVAVSTTDIHYSELKQMSYNSIQTSFAVDDLKDSLIEQLDQKFKVFEQQYMQDSE